MTPILTAPHKAEIAPYEARVADDDATAAPPEAAAPSEAPYVIVGIDGGAGEKPIRIAIAGVLLDLSPATVEHAIEAAISMSPWHVAVIERSTDALFNVDAERIARAAASAPKRVRKVENTRARFMVIDTPHLYERAKCKGEDKKNGTYYYIPRSLPDDVAAIALSMLRYNQTEPFRPSRKNPESPWLDHLKSREDDYNNPDVDDWMRALPLVSLDLDPEELFIDRKGRGAKQSLHWNRKNISWFARILRKNPGISWNEFRRVFRKKGPMSELRGRLMRAYVAKKFDVPNVAHGTHPDRTPERRTKAFHYIDATLLRIWHSPRSTR